MPVSIPFGASHRWALVMLFAVALFFQLAAVPPADAQSELATVFGRVTDPSGAVVPTAEVEIKNVETNMSVVRSTNSDGLYTIPSLHPGHYLISVRKPGFKTVTVTELKLDVQDNVVRNFQLQLGSASESVTVTADSATVNTTDATVSTVVDRQFVENLPLNGRSVQGLIELTPGVVLGSTTSTSGAGDQGQFSVNGQRVDANYFTIDGVSVNFAVPSAFDYGQTANGATPALSAFGGTNNLVSVDALQEFRIQTSTYAPEFGRLSGAQISLVTRSGSDQYHGTLFDYLRNDIFDANDWFADNKGLQKPKVRQNDFGGVFGGPIVKQKTFFFFSYEGLRLRQPRVAVTDVPSLHARQAAPPAVQPQLNAYPLPTGPSTGPDQNEFAATYSDPASLDATSIRIDHTVNSKVSVFGRYNYSPSSRNARGASSQEALSVVTNTFFTTHTVTLGAAAILSPTITNDFRFNYSREAGGLRENADTFGGAVVPPASVLFPGGSSKDARSANFIASLRSGNWEDGADANNLQRQINIVDSISVVKGTHQMKVGGDFRRLTPVEGGVAQTISLGWFAINSNVFSSVADGYFHSIHLAKPAFAFNNFSAFAQDTWQALPSLTLTYGLRWDYNPPPSETSGHPPFVLDQVRDLSTIALAPSGAPLWHAPKANFAPRVGVSYMLTKNRDLPTVLRAGFGMFYDLGTATAGSVGDDSRTPYWTFSFVNNAPLPFTGPSPSLTFAPPYALVEGFDPNLKLPYSLEWSVGVERALTTNQTLTLTYLGSVGRQLLRRDFIQNPNPTFSFISLTRNSAYSNYDALQVQFRRRMSYGLQALASYTWSHSLDLTSSDSTDGGGLPTNLYNLQQDYGDSNFDVRHALTVGLTYDLPGGRFSNSVARAVARSWAIDTLIQAHTPGPFNVLYTPVNQSSFDPLGSPLSFRPDRAPDEPLYVSASTVAGGKRLNPAAFTIPAVLRQGDLRRNAVRGFNLIQTDFSLRRQFSITERWKLLFRADAFNIFNHPNFGNPSNFLDQGGFGVSPAMYGQSLQPGGSFSSGFNSLYQIGGARSMQMSAKVQF